MFTVHGHWNSATKEVVLTKLYMEKEAEAYEVKYSGVVDCSAKKMYGNWKNDAGGSFGSWHCFLKTPSGMQPCLCVCVCICGFVPVYAFNVLLVIPMPFVIRKIIDGNHMIALIHCRFYSGKLKYARAKNH